MTQRDRDRRLASMWNQGYLVSVIAQKLNFNHGSSVSHAAKRLGLPRRRRPTNIGPAVLAVRQAAQARRDAEMLTELAKVELEDPRKGGFHWPRPVWYRCEICGGRSPTPIHEADAQQERVA